MILKTSNLKLSFIFLLLSTIHFSHAKEYDKLIDEEYLRSEFTFGKHETIKFMDCKKKTYPTCNYIWGSPSKSDATRIKFGMTPEGKKVTVIYVQATKQADFDRSIAVYRDAVEVDSIGARSVWSASRAQLSVMTESNLIIHVHLEAIQDGKVNEHAINIAKYILKQL